MFNSKSISGLWPAMAAVFFLGSNIAMGQVVGDFSMELQLENRYFVNEGLYENQERNFFSIAINPEYSLEWGQGKHNFKANLWGRWDQHDDHRTHFDVRELYYQHVKGNTEFSIGLKKVFWGVTEAAHLVDIVNQTDQVESFDGEQKLGQPMLHLSYFTGVGTFDFFYFPYNRRRQFPAEKGRLRFPIVISRDDIPIDSDYEEWQPGGAVRWSHYFGPIDIGLSHFYGMGREPLFLPGEGDDIIALYPVINQSGLDLQATTGPVLWKFEGIYRHAELQDFWAYAGGLEYTFWNVANTGMDIGVLGEYLYDGRGNLALNSMQNDLFVGSRIAFNDTQSTDILFGAIFDLEHSTRFFSVESSRRINNSMKLEIEGRFFERVSENEFAYFFRQDSFLRIGLSKYF